MVTGYLPQPLTPAPAFSSCYVVRLLAALLLAMLLVAAVQAQTFSVIHNFTGGGDGAVPAVGLTLDRTGNLYGTTWYGGVAGSCEGNGCGVVFKMSQRNSNWTFTPLYRFTGGSDGAVPDARVVFGSNGTLYGSAYAGGSSSYPEGAGVIFNLQPPAHASSRVFEPWVETPLYAFGGVSDGSYPSGDLVFDAAGNIYGTTQSGGYECEDTVYCGTVFELAHNGSSWSESILYEFTNENVAIPVAGVIFDQAGNLFGTTSNSPGAVFELAPSGGGWTENTIHGFGGQGDGYNPAGGLILGSSGAFYGATTNGGANGAGVLYQLTQSGGEWHESVLYSFTGMGPDWNLTKDAGGNYYGTTCEGGSHNSGSVFKLAPSGGSWVQTVLYQFTGATDGYCPMGGVTVDAAGNLYGTAYAGGAYGYGAVWEITQ